VSSEVDQLEEAEGDLEQFLDSLGFHYMWSQLCGHGFSSVTHLAQKSTLDELKSVVGNSPDTVQLH